MSVSVKIGSVQVVRWCRPLLPQHTDTHLQQNKLRRKTGACSTKSNGNALPPRHVNEVNSAKMLQSFERVKTVTTSESERCGDKRYSRKTSNTDGGVRLGTVAHSAFSPETSI